MYRILPWNAGDITVGYCPVLGSGTESMRGLQPGLSGLLDVWSALARSFEATRLHTDSLVVLAPFKVFPCEEKPRNIV